MRLITSTPEAIELKYTVGDYQLIWDYIGPDRTKGDTYYGDNYIWIEVFNDVTDEWDQLSGAPVGIMCVTENAYCSFSLHLSVFEVISKNHGWGTLILRQIEDLAKGLGDRYVTLMPRNKEVISFYTKNGYKWYRMKDVWILGKTVSLS
jgi:GNAT superfamily N-acetyltransferase